MEGIIDKRINNDNNSNLIGSGLMIGWGRLTGKKKGNDRMGEKIDFR